jgi:hypothetical protein
MINKWNIAIKLIAISSIAIFFIYTLQLIIIRIAKGGEITPCTSIEFILAGTLELALTTVFIFLTHKITIVVKE